MVLKFKKLSFVIPVNLDAMYENALHCLGLVLEISDYERFIIGSIRLFSDYESEGVGVFSLSVPAFVDVLDAFRNISAMGGNVLTTPITRIDEIPSHGLSIELPLRDGEMEANLSLSDFAVTVRTKNCLADLTITSAGFFRLMARADTAALER